MWSVMVRDQSGRNRRFNLGEFPTIGISEAREQAGATRYRVRQEGADPTAEKKAARQKSAAPAEMTLSGLLDEFTRVVKHDSKTWPAYRRLVELVVGPLLDKPASSLTLADLQRGADSYPALGTASRAVAYLRPVLKWGAARDYVDFKTTLISQPRPTIQRERFLNADELRTLIVELRGGSNYHAGASRHAKYPDHRAALMMILYTATRLNEVCGATWSEFDLDPGDGAHPAWTIPRSRIKDTRRAGSKSRKKRPPHVLPLPRQVLNFIIARRPGNWQPNELVFPNEAGGALGNWDRVTKHLFDATGTSGWTRHDLRRTAATMMGEMGTPPHVIESVLNHATIHSSLADTYNRSRYLTEVGEALQKWADWIDRLVAVG
ncbi:hypothetical protein ACOSOMT5_P2204 [Acidiphilium sp. MT5]